MERTEWLKQMQAKMEELFDHCAPEYWVNFGFSPNETHLQFVQKLLDRVPAHSTLLSAACGAGRYDGILLEEGHKVVGIDQSAGMLARAAEHFPEVRYEKIGLQVMDFREEFDGAICVDAMENISPEDWPGIMQGFQKAIKPGGILYFTVELPEADLQASYERAKAMGLPVVFGEVADKVDKAYEELKGFKSPGVPGDLAAMSVYHFYPSPEQVKAWIEQAGMEIEQQGTGNGYEHYLVRKR